MLLFGSEFVVFYIYDTEGVNLKLVRTDLHDASPHGKFYCRLYINYLECLKIAVKIKKH